jgi:hypothetical protein
MAIPQRKPVAVVRIGGGECAPDPVLAARAYFRVSTCLAILGKRLVGI